MFRVSNKSLYHIANLEMKSVILIPCNIALPNIANLCIKSFILRVSVIVLATTSLNLYKKSFMLKSA